MKRLFIVLILLLAGCKGGEVEDQSIVEILAPECDDAEQETCCENACVDFCKQKGLSFTKYVVNGEHCPCWCD